MRGGAHQLGRSPALSATPASAQRLSAVDSATSFTLVSADDVPYAFHLSADMCTHSLYLQTAKEVGAVEGCVPVGTAQAVRDYVAYLKYLELRSQLAIELARNDNSGSTVRESRGAATASSSSPATTTLLSMKPRQEGQEARTAALQVHSVPFNQQPRARPLTTGALDDEWLSPFLWEEGVLAGSLFNEADEDVDLTAPCGTASLVGYELQPLDCDRNYVQHAAALWHWLAVEELAALRGEAPSAEQEGTDIDDQAGRRLAMAAAAETSEEVISATLRGAAVGGPDDAAGEVGEDANARLPPPLIATENASFSLSSSTSSLSEASLAAYKADVQRCAGLRECDVPLLGREPGYGAQLALQEREGMFFIERVLLPHEWRRGCVNVSHGGAPHTSDLCNATASHDERCSAGGGEGIIGQGVGAARNKLVSSDAMRLQPFSSSTAQAFLTASQQRRLLELIAVADFLGTQSLVELCATYLAAWLMDRSDEEVVQSFLAESAAEGVRVGTSAPVPKYQLTGATVFQEPWLRRTTSAELTAASSKAGDATAEAAPQKCPPQSTGASTKRAMKPVKKSTAAATSKKGKRSKDTKEAAEEAEEDEEKRRVDASSRTATSIASGANQRSGLISGDQRLSVVRQVKRNGSIMISPY
jgi:hypothetical protein